MKVPTVHLNGTSGDELLRQVREAGAALRSALDALYEMAPNARDYYVQGDSAFEAARKEHGARIEAVSSVKKQVEEIHSSIYTQVSARQAVRP